MDFRHLFTNDPVYKCALCAINTSQVAHILWVHQKSTEVLCTLCDRHTCYNTMAHLVSFLQRKQTQPSWDLRLRLSKLGNQSDQSSSWQIFITSPIKDDLHKSDIINTAPGTLPIYCKDLFTIHCTALPHFLELPYWHYQLVLS